MFAHKATEAQSTDPAVRQRQGSAAQRETTLGLGTMGVEQAEQWLAGRANKPVGSNGMGPRGSDKMLENGYWKKTSVCVDK
jgi:hypothetical protein